MASIYVHHAEDFDDYTAIINGFKPNYRLTIVRNLKKKPGKLACLIVYQADAKGRMGLKKLINLISDFRYEFNNSIYQEL